jgi:RNA polymerase sigma-70 factor (ECF subfamily)
MRDGDFERLYAEHAQPLLGFLAYRTGDRALAEDLLADTFERVLTARRPFDPRKATQKTWLYTIALNLLRDHARRTAARDRAVDRVLAGAYETRQISSFDAVDERDAVHRAMKRLTEEEREVIALRYGGELTMPEIATLTHLNLTTVEGRLYRALRKLKPELSETHGR